MLHFIFMDESGLGIQYAQIVLNSCSISYSTCFHMDKIAKRIENCRRHLNFSQSELARKVRRNPSGCAKMGKSQNRSPGLYIGKTGRCAWCFTGLYPVWNYRCIFWRSFFRRRRKDRIPCNRLFKTGGMAFFHFQRTVQPLQRRATFSYQSIYRNSLAIGRPEGKLIPFTHISPSITPCFVIFQAKRFIHF